MTRTIKRPATREDWLAARKPYIGGSEVAIVLGLSPWKTPVDLWLEKTGRREPDDTPSEAMRLGNELEDYAARRYTEQTGRAVRNFGYMILDDDAHLCADIDRLVVPEGASVAAHHDEIRTNRLLECKTSGVAWEDNEVPAHYQAQVQTYLALSRCDIADFAAVFLAPRRDFRGDLSVERDDDVCAAIREKVKSWYERHVLGDTAPEAVCEADCKALWASSRGVEVAATSMVAQAVADLRATADQIKSLEAHEEELRMVIMRHMGEADTLVGPDGHKLATWKSPKPTARTDWKAVAAAMEGDARFAAAVAANTAEKPGARRFLLAK